MAIKKHEANMKGHEARLKRSEPWKIAAAINLRAM
jgi:hypothetical protein